MSLLYTSVLSDEANGRKPLHPPMTIGSPRFLQSEEDKRWQHLYVLPVLLLEFLALALTRAVIPALLLHKFGNNVYLVMGVAEFVKGLLAFFACPVFGKLSDVLGRRVCLFVTVLGSCEYVYSTLRRSDTGRDLSFVITCLMSCFLFDVSIRCTCLFSCFFLMVPITANRFMGPAKQQHILH